jgi:hypothetical protein
MVIPNMTATIAIQVERFVVSPKNSQLKTAAIAGVALRITNVLAMEVIYLLNTRPEALPNINTPETSSGQPLSFTASVRPRLSLS